MAHKARGSVWNKGKRFLEQEQWEDLWIRSAVNIHTGNVRALKHLHGYSERFWGAKAVINVGHPSERSHNINTQENLSSIHLGLRRMIQHTGKLFKFPLIKETLTAIHMRLYTLMPTFRPLIKTQMKFSWNILLKRSGFYIYSLTLALKKPCIFLHNLFRRFHMSFSIKD